MFCGRKFGRTEWDLSCVRKRWCIKVIKCPSSVIVECLGTDIVFAKWIEFIRFEEMDWGFWKSKWNEEGKYV
jgi:hypothetical protein